MASIMDSIKASSNRLLSSAAGKVGKAIDVVGGILGNPLPEVKAFGPQGLSGALESKGSAALTPQQQAEKVTTRTAEINKANPDLNLKPVYTTQNVQYSLPQDQQKTYDQIVQDYKARGWTDEAAIKGDIAAGNYKPSVTTSGDSGSKAGFDSNAVKQSVKDSIYGKYVGDSDVQDLLDKYAREGRSDADALAADIESRAVARADREYNTILEALRGQKAEAGTLAEQQKTDIATDTATGLSSLEAKKARETASIEKQKEGFIGETEQTADTLARNWKDMSLQVQRMMRARGAQDSSYAAGEETKVLMDFNKGLKQLAVSKTNALGDFADAVNETVRFYGEEATKLDESGKRAARDVDTWLRGRIGEIQGQEGVALNKKLADIDNAITQANSIKINTETKIRDQKLAYGLWLEQSKKQLEQAVAVAAAGKVSSAQNNISNYSQQFALTKQILGSGGEMTTSNAKGEQGLFVHGKLPTTGEDIYIPITQGGAQNIALQQAAELAKARQVGDFTSNILPSTSLNTAASDLGYGSLVGGTTAPQTGSFDESIRNALGM